MDSAKDLIFFDNFFGFMSGERGKSISVRPIDSRKAKDVDEGMVIFCDLLPLLFCLKSGLSTLGRGGRCCLFVYPRAFVVAINDGA